MSFDLSRLSLTSSPRLSFLTRTAAKKESSPTTQNLKRKCIKSFKLVVHGGWGIDDNDNLANPYYDFENEMDKSAMDSNEEQAASH
ncbi:hypothetical protein F2Q70_00010923 [Brassica cretica]|uniref:Uncharacterized protein n=1 Tax=Brassica cretica TaxID=69181 RepID=A0A8S9M3U7_BRACR|nr:hypothetical protein F2Q70_00010923 [Brassica cretica]